MRKRNTVAATFVAAGAVVGTLIAAFRPASDHEAGWERPTPSEHAGIARLHKWHRRAGGEVFRRRPPNPAASSFREEWILGAPGDRDAEKLLEAAKSAIGLSDLLDDEHPGWADFYNGLTDPFFMHDVVAVCGEEVRPTQSCFLGVRVVASPAATDDDERSLVELSEVAGTEPDTAECRAYASCVADAMLGRDLPPFPEGIEDPRGTEVTWHMDAWDDKRLQVNRERILGCIATCNEALSMLAETTLDSVEDQRYQVGKYQSRLDWCEMLLSELDGA